MQYGYLPAMSHIVENLQEQGFFRRTRHNDKIQSKRVIFSPTGIALPNVLRK
jgi:hypothetical protein